MIDLTDGDWTSFLILILALTFAIFFRYVVLAGIFYYFFNIKGYLFRRKLSTKSINKDQLRKEIFFSFVSSFIFAILGSILYRRWQTDQIVYRSSYTFLDLFWILGGLILILLVHETYYYWLHRWMHRPAIYKNVHKAHHESLTTTAWTSFSFHPFESFLQGLPIFLLFYFIPFHLISILLALIIMAFTSVINHLNTEVYNQKFSRHWLGKWWIGATHHHLHHRQFKFNYGLYFTFWDHWMKTESPDFKKFFAEILKP